MSFIESAETGAERQEESLRGVYERVLRAAGTHRAIVLQVRADELARHIRRAAVRRADIAAPGHAAEQWLHVNLGQGDDRLKRGAVAALALGLEHRVGHLPDALRAAYPAAQAKLARSVGAERPYAFPAFCRDAALVAGLAAPIGSMNVFIPERSMPEGLPLRTRKALTSLVRHARQFGGQDGRAFFAATGVRPWAEFHLDLRALESFNAEGFTASYHLIAALLRSRPDLAGLYAGSWLYDPRVAAISPELAFVRRTAEDGGARIVRLRPDPVQSRYAIARSPARRRLVESGAYRPVCYGMYWAADELLAWSERTHSRQTSHLQVVRK